MKRRLAWITVSTVLLWSGCAGPDPQQRAPTPELPAEVAAALPTPFTAEQIRDEWSQGLRLFVERTEGGGSPFVERWTVIESDADQATIEFAVLDASGSPAGEPAVGPSSWSELRDHARFAAGSAERVQVERETELGTLRGWLYTVNEEDGIVTEYFFADSFPGAPVEMVTRRGDESVATFRQLERVRIDLP